MSEISSIYFGNKVVQSIETKSGVLYGGGDPFEYEAVDGGYAVTGFKNSLLRKGTYPKNISIPESHNDQPVVEIGENAFKSLDLIEQVFIPASVKRVKQFAFSYCYAIVTLDEACNFEFIGNNCFTRCSGFSTLRVNGTIEGQLKFFADLTSVIGNYSFQSGLSLEGDSKLTSINLESVTTINSYGMQGVGLQEVNIPNCTNIGHRAFQYNTTVKTLYLSTSTIYFNSYCFYGTAFEEVHCKASDISRFNSSYFKRVYLIGDDTSIPNGMLSGCSLLEELVINNGCLTIRAGACFNCTSLREVTIPNSVTSIGQNVFKNCSSLTSITISNGVTEIGSSAFDGCSSLTSVVIPDSVTTIGRGAFSGCSGLTSITLPFVGDAASSAKFPFGHIFGTTNYSGGVQVDQSYNNGYNWQSITYYLPALLKTVVVTGGDSLPGYSFSNCQMLINITLPSTLTSIGVCAFLRCSGLTSITLPNGVLSIGTDAFQYCSALINITVPNTVTSIGDRVFEFCSSLTEFIIPNGVTTIPEWAFSYCSSLAEISIPNSVTMIDSYAFLNCTSLTEVTIPSIITGGGRGYSAFRNCTSLITVTISSGITYVCESMFESCSSLVNCTIPNTVTKIGKEAFDSCTSLTNIVYEGTQAQWNSITFGNNWKRDVPATVVHCTDGDITL